MAERGKGTFVRFPVWLKGGCMAARGGTTNHKLALARLRELMVDPARFSADADTIASYVEPGRDAKKLICVVYPRSQADVGHVLTAARSYDLAVYSPIPWGLAPARDGIVLDYRSMDHIKSVDTKSLFLEIEPGVTWEQVLSELAGLGVKVAMPAAARSPYVLESALEREIVLPAARFTNRQLATFHVMLADGREYRSGSDALPASRTHWREDGGPNISRVFTGSRNSFGLPLRGFVYLYPEPEERTVVTFGVRRRSQACELARRCARSEIGTEVLCLSKAKAQEVADGVAGLSAWSVVFGLEGTPRLVEYHRKRIGEIAGDLKIKAEPAKAEVDDAMGDALGRPWYAPDLSFGFYTTFGRVEELSSLAASRLEGAGKAAQMVIPIKRGASAYVQYDLAAGDAETAAAAVKELLVELSDAGAFFPNPTGSLAKHIFGKQPSYKRLLKELKGIIDPGNVLNSGQVVEV